MITVDIGMISLAYFCAYLLRFEGNIPQNHISLYVKTIFIIITLKLSFFFYFNLYRGMWRYTGLSDFVKILQAAAISSTSLALLILLFFHNHGFSRSVLVLDFILTFIFVAGSRLSIRILFLNDVQSFHLFDRAVKTSKKKLLIIGAGDAGEFILREIKDNPKINFEPIGFLDDNRSKWGQEIHGVRVLGDVEHISKIKNKFDEILIAIPSATGVQMKQLVSMCEKVGKPFKTMPAVGELLDGRVSMKVVREVTLSDVIGRDEVHIDEQSIREFLLNKKVLVTGAGGSIGSELVRQISCFDPRSIALLDFSEYNLYQVEIDNRKRFKDINAYLVDLRNLHTTQRVFKEFKPDIVFHTAAYKHVPLQELNPWEALSNNLLGMKL